MIEPVVESPPVEPREPEGFPRAYVEQLRAESADHRAKAAHADALTGRLVDTMAGATGLLADASDLARYADRSTLLGEDGLPDDAKVQAAVEELVAERPHLRSRRPAGGLDVGQGGRAARPAAVDLAGMLRAAAS